MKICSRGDLGDLLGGPWGPWGSQEVKHEHTHNRLIKSIIFGLRLSINFSQPRIDADDWSSKHKRGTDNHAVGTFSNVSVRSG